MAHGEVTIGDGSASFGDFNLTQYPSTDALLHAAIRSEPHEADLHVLPGTYPPPVTRVPLTRPGIRVRGSEAARMEVGPAGVFDVLAPGVRVEDLAFVKPAAGAPSGASVVAILIDAVPRVVVRRCLFVPDSLNVTCVRAVGATELEVEGNRFGELAPATTAMQFAVDLENVEFSSIVGNRARRLADVEGVFRFVSTEKERHHLTVTGNRFEEVIRAGSAGVMLFAGGRFCLVEGNSIGRCLLSNAPLVQFDAGADGLRGAANRFAENDVHNGGGDHPAVYVDRCDDVEIEGNTFTLANGPLLELADAPGADVDGNKFGSNLDRSADFAIVHSAPAEEQSIRNNRCRSAAPWAGVFDPTAAGADLEHGGNIVWT